MSKEQEREKTIKNLEEEYWEMYSLLILGDYIQEWPSMHNSGFYAYRYRDEGGMIMTSLRLSRITLDHLDNESPPYNENLRDVFFNGENPNTDGHFLKIRFSNDKEGTKDLGKTARFLLEETKYVYLFRWQQPGNPPQNNLWVYLP